MPSAAALFEIRGAAEVTVATTEAPPSSSWKVLRKRKCLGLRAQVTKFRECRTTLNLPWKPRPQQDWRLLFIYVDLSVQTRLKCMGFFCVSGWGWSWGCWDRGHGILPAPSFVFVSKPMVSEVSFCVSSDAVAPGWPPESEQGLGGKFLAQHRCRPSSPKKWTCELADHSWFILKAIQTCCLKPRASAQGALPPASIKALCMFGYNEQPAWWRTAGQA